MLRALWFFAQLAIVVCAALWIAMQKGMVDIVWNNYELSIQLGVFLLFLTVFTLIVVMFFRITGFLLGTPEALSRRRREKNREKGYAALTRGFAALAAGDSKKAAQAARDVGHYLPPGQPLPLLLEAQAARLQGDEAGARKIFEKLLSDKDAGFLGVRGLVSSSLEAGEPHAALLYARSALEKNPKNQILLKTAYELELQNRHWHAAADLLQRVQKYKAVDESKARSDEIALLVLLAEEDKIAHNEAGWLKKIEKAHKIDPAFVPVAVMLGEYYASKGKTGKVVGLVETAWRKNPHPALAALWDKIAPDNKASDPLRRLRWFEKLLSFKPDSVEGQIAAARAAMDAGLNGEAKTYLTAAENIQPCAGIYRLWADLEEQTTRNPVIIRAWMDKAAQAAPDPVWYCTATGHIYERWSPVAEPHGAFNTIRWGHPFLSNAGIEHTAWQDPLLMAR